MADLIDEFNAMKIKVAKAMAEGDEATLHSKIHVVDQVAERERKRTNPKKSTIIRLNCRTPEQWSEMQMAKEPYFELAGDPHIAIDLIVRALTAFSEHTILEWAKQGYEKRARPVGPPRGELPAAPAEDEMPEWMKD